MKVVGSHLPLRDALLIKSAEFWLKLGQPVQALLELEQLPANVQEHPWARMVLQSALEEGRFQPSVSKR